jgi:hypothetical protein
MSSQNIPIPPTVTTLPNTSRHEAMHEFAGVALQGLMARVDSYLLTNEELAEKAWSIADTMLKEAPKHNVFY